MLAHLRQQLTLTTGQGVAQRGFPAQPGRQHQPGLGPAEDPRDGPQAFDAPGATFCRAAAQRQAPQFLFWRRLAEVLDEIGILPYHAAVGLDTIGGQLVHHFTPGRLRGRWWQQRGFKHGSQVQVEVLLGNARQAELEADHFTLLGGAETPRHRTRWLRQDRGMGRAAASPDRTATAVEQQQLDLMLGTDTHQVFLSPVLRPGSSRGAGVLGRIGVADHHFLRAAQARAVARQAKQALHDRAGIVEVGQGLEQWHHTHGAGQAGFLEQQLHRQYIRGGTGHGDDVRPQRGGRRSGHFPAGRQHFGGVRLRLEMRRQQGPAVFQLGLEERDALLLIPVGVTPQAQVIGNLGQRITVAGSVLAYVQAAQEQAEGHRTTQAVKQRPLGDHAHAAFVQ
ncbi:hypothetical protein D3C79_667600 [compost metagenome]